jgi:chemotaxis family two-component system response regulator Rcp1
MKNKRFTIVSIEDNEPDFVLLEKALSAATDLPIELINIQNGKEAIDFLYKNEDYKSAPNPDLIVLDINIPKINGLDILRSIKNDDNLKTIPVIIFSTSDSEKDIKDSYALYANSYITKTFDIKELFKKIAVMANYWLKTTELPDVPNFSDIKKTNEADNKKE